MLAEFVLDTADLKTWLVAGLFAISLFTLGAPLLSKAGELFDWFSSSDSSFPELPVPADPNGTGSDKPAPAGISQYLTMVKETAPNANHEVWWDYAELGMTQAQIAMDEAKLAPQNRKEEVSA